MKLLVITAVAIVFLFAAGCSYQPIFDSADIRADVTITENRDIIEITPEGGSSSVTALLFYPGGLVDSHVYDEILADFTAETGLMSIVVKMPADLAVFGVNSGLDVIENSDYQNIETWVIAGHSLGGAMAAAHVNNHRGIYEGLIFMDSYPPDGDSLSDWDGAVLSLFSSIEKISDKERMDKTLSLIPKAYWLSEGSREYPEDKTSYSVIHQIDGGSHSYFGTYGPQRGDYTPTISRDEFHAEVIDYMQEFFVQNGWL